MLKINDLTAGYRKDYPIIDSLSLSLRRGERLAITGRNGAGKSTFANALMKFVPFITGDVIYNDVKLLHIPTSEYKNKGVGYFIQDGVVFPNLNVLENLQIAMKTRSNEMLEPIIEKLGRFNINMKTGNFLKQKAGNLSGGERNLLALLMVMSSKPSLMILDEPFAGISPNNISMLGNIMKDYISRDKCSMILIDQNRSVLEELCDKTYILKNKTLNPA